MVQLLADSGWASESKPSLSVAQAEKLLIAQKRRSNSRMVSKERLAETCAIC